MTEIKQLEAMKQLKMMDLKILLKMFWKATINKKKQMPIIQILKVLVKSLKRMIRS